MVARSHGLGWEQTQSSQKAEETELHLEHIPPTPKTPGSIC